jgi:hypothetical protein
MKTSEAANQMLLLHLVKRLRIASNPSADNNIVLGDTL